MKVGGQNLNRNTIKETIENGQKTPSDEWPGWCQWCQASRLRGCGMILNSVVSKVYNGRSPQSDSSWSLIESLNWPCMTARRHQFCYSQRQVPLFGQLNEHFPVKILKEKFGLFVDFEFLTEMGSWGTNLSIPVGLRKILQRKVVEKCARKIVEVPVFRAEMIVT